MARHEIKARIELQVEEWKESLATTMWHAEDSTGDAKGAYLRAVARLQGQLDDVGAHAATSWGAADARWDAASKDIEVEWEAWQLCARTSLSEFSN